MLVRLGELWCQCEARGINKVASLLYTLLLVILRQAKQSITYVRMQFIDYC